MPHVQVVNPGVLLNFCNFVKQNVLPVYYKQLYKTEPLNHQRNDQHNKISAFVFLSKSFCLSIMV